MVYKYCYFNSYLTKIYVKESVTDIMKHPVQVFHQESKSFAKRSACQIFILVSGVTVVTPTDRPKSVRNRCVIEVLGGIFLFSCWCRGFFQRTESDLFLFLIFLVGEIQPYLKYRGTSKTL